MAVTSSTTTSNGAAYRVDGLVSGVKTDELIAGIMEIEGRPLKDLDSRKTQLTNELTAWRAVNSIVLGLDSTLSRLASSDFWGSRTATSSDTAALTAAASAGGDLGTYTVSVEALATTHQLISQGFDSTEAAVGGGTITIQVGEAVKPALTLPADKGNLAGLRDAINGAGLGVTASILDQGTAAGVNRYRLVVNSGTSGMAGKVTITFGLSGIQPVMSDLTAAADAHLKLGTGASAVDVYSSSNTVTTALPGVTLSLKKAEPGKALAVALGTDTATLRQGVQGFLDAYNALANRFNDEFRYDSATGATGTLFGNGPLMTLQSRLVDETLASRNVGGAYNSLSALGIGLDAKGKLTIKDNDAFSKALTRPQDLRKLFTDPDRGLAVRMKKETTLATDVHTGSVSLEEKSLEERLEVLDASRLRVAERLTRYEESLRVRFTEMESALAALESQSKQVTAMLGSSKNGGS